MGPFLVENHTGAQRNSAARDQQERADDAERLELNRARSENDAERNFPGCRAAGV
jgi:hypothetical protein